MKTLTPLISHAPGKGGRAAAVDRPQWWVGWNVADHDWGPIGMSRDRHRQQYNSGDGYETRRHALISRRDNRHGVQSLFASTRHRQFFSFHLYRLSMPRFVGAPERFDDKFAVGGAGAVGLALTLKLIPPL